MSASEQDTIMMNFLLKSISVSCSTVLWTSRVTKSSIIYNRIAALEAKPKAKLSRAHARSSSILMY